MEFHFLFFCRRIFNTFYLCNRFPCLLQSNRKTVTRKVRFYKKNHFKPSSHTCRYLMFFRTLFLTLSASLVSHFFKTIKIRKNLPFFSSLVFASADLINLIIHSLTEKIFFLFTDCM